MYKVYLSMLVYLFLFFTEGCASQEEYQYLDALAVKAGADKGSFYHNYTDVYAKYFASLKEKPIKFLEIGIYQGASVKLWEEYFKNADLHFMDITFQEVRYSSNRSHYHLCNQESSKELQSFIATSGGNFDIIIDDGGHTMNQQITSFRELFPHLKSGGMYIIEDLHTSYWDGWGSDSGQNTIAFLKSLIDEVNFVGMCTTRASHLVIAPSIATELNIYREKIYSMHFYDSLVVIIKR
ncbi:MAG: class I SAM-dependent methyltransferase [Ignavibacteriae bacterium]|nr:class I SAM-dependent methyltransferase [Ignavibacteriota bacterium]